MSLAGRIYVLHFEPALFHARHYIGFTESEDVLKRVQEHLSLRTHSSPLVKAVIASGGQVDLVLDIEGSRSDERELKLRKNARSICPRCRPKFLGEAAQRMRAMRSRV